MSKYTIEFTDTEELAMQYISVSVDSWLQNAAHERARIAIDEIVHLSVSKFLEVNEPTPASKEEIVSQAFARGWVKPSSERNQEIQPLY